MDENLNIQFNLTQMMLVALNTSCCVKEAARKLGISRRALVNMNREYGIIREGNRYVVKKQSQSKRPQQIVA